MTAMPKILKGLEHYADPNDRSRVVYYAKDTPVKERLQKVIDDACGPSPPAVRRRIPEHRGLSAPSPPPEAAPLSSKEVIERTEATEETTAMFTNGAYSGEEIQQLAAEKNIDILTTGLVDRKPNPILSQFELSEDEHHVVSCPEGHEPKSTS